MFVACRSSLNTATSMAQGSTTTPLPASSDIGEFKTPLRQTQNSPFVTPRYITAYAEMVFPVNFFIDGRQGDGQLDLDVARGFFQYGRMPDDFHRASKPMSVEGIVQVIPAHPWSPGSNVNGVNTYTPEPNAANFFTIDPSGCEFYGEFVNQTVVGLYPNPTGVLREALNRNLDLFYQASTGGNCTQTFPYGKDE
jgi:hypothetical protein